MTRGTTFFRWFMYLLHISIVTVSQNCTIPSISSCFVLGLTSLLQNSLSSCHIFSIGFKSGDSTGVFHQLIPWSLMKSRAKLEVYLGSLSCMKRCELGNFAWMNGMSVWSRISVNRNLSIIPSKCRFQCGPFLRSLPTHGLSQGALLYKDNKVYAHLCRLHMRTIIDYKIHTDINTCVKHLPWLWPGGLSLFPATKQSMCFQLNC